MKAPSIRRRLTRAILLLFFVVVTVGVGSIYMLFRLALVNQFNAALVTKAHAVSALISRRGAIDKDHLGDRIMRDFDQEQHRDYFEVWSPDRKVTARSGSLRGTDLPRLVGASGTPNLRRVTLTGGRDVTIVDLVFPPRPPDEEDEPDNRPALSSIHLAVATSRHELDELLTMLALICAGIVVVLSATTLLIPRVLRHLLGPLEQMTAQTRSIDAESLATRLPTNGLPVELRPIAECLNDLFARLEASFDRERRVTADLAHELRTPLAELKTWAGSALRWPESRDPATDREVMDAAQHMEAIVTRMLALARSELGKMPVASERVDVSALVAQAWKSFEGRAVAKKLGVEWSLSAVTCETDPVLLRSILTNLFENAVEYTPAGGLIHIASAGTPTGVSIQMSNPAPDLKPEDVRRFFERFWRKEEARSGEQHFGLGLAIAQSFARSLGWRLAATLAKDQRLTFELTSTPVAR